MRNLVASRLLVVEAQLDAEVESLYGLTEEDSAVVEAEALPRASDCRSAGERRAGLPDMAVDTSIERWGPPYSDG